MKTKPLVGIDSAWDKKPAKKKPVKKLVKKEIVIGFWTEIEVVYGLMSRCPYCKLRLDEQDVSHNSEISIEECEKFNGDVTCPKCKKVFRLKVDAV